jgi:hypothetical protein
MKHGAVLQWEISYLDLTVDLPPSDGCGGVRCWQPSEHPAASNSHFLLKNIHEIMIRSVMEKVD